MRNRSGPFRFLAAVLCGLALVAALAFGQESSPSQTSGWKVCQAAYDVRNYDSKDAWALIVNQGRDGRLYGYYSFENSPPGLSGGLRDELVRFRDVLRARGTELIVVVIPGKGLLEYDRVDVRTLRRKSVDINFLRSRYKEYVQSFQRAGVYAVDLVGLGLRDQSGKALYFKHDHHWTPQFAGLVAKDIANHVRTTPAYPALPKVPVTIQDRPEKTTYGSYATVLRKLCNLTLLPEAYVSRVTKYPGAGGDLLSDVEPGIALVGDSHSREPSFATLLRFYLQRDVVVHALPGGGAAGPMETYLLTGEYTRMPPKVLIWEFETGIAQPGFLARLAAAAQGPCTGRQRMFRGSVRPKGQTVTLRLPRPMTPAAGGYLHIRVSDRSIRQLDVAGTQVVLNERTTNNGNFFIPVPAASLTQLNLRFPAVPKGEIAVSVCRPAGDRVK
ncbi:hypothetical protein GCM10008955_07660 [Deinococcus malanensis]|uniref:AlgX/AlgJ SGNH hydrolase-like domain-containing protein n=1 Tax=Deinococcus malanensis TaxID=1706855 RepID=A0ABQ2EMV1_9DEIO|nr:hypothetical protein [Deinococcus malanensis]GGK16717.1 hypothetical protein GCM10008955_07660 [Deinococcus malanensis]